MGKKSASFDGPNASEDSGSGPQSEDQARRAFLRKAGKFAAVTPPAITLLLGTSLGSEALAASSGSRPGKRPGIFPGRGPKKPHKPFKPGRGPKKLGKRPKNGWRGGL
jgi:hypothetical protein